MRYCYEGGTLKRDGRLLPVGDASVTGADIIAALKVDGVDLAHYSPRVYAPQVESWAPLKADTQFAENNDDDQQMIHIMLFRHTPAAVPPLEEEGKADGFFTVGVVGAKTAYNLGSLWRSAYQFGAAGLFVVNDRGATASLKQTSDTTKAWRRVPLVSHDDWHAFCGAQPYGAMWVAVEMGGEPLETFEHPERAVYILGSGMQRRCHAAGVGVPTNHIGAPTDIPLGGVDSRCVQRTTDCRRASCVPATGT